MSDINFLANNQREDDQEPKSRDNKAEQIVWSEPDKNKPLVREAPFSLLTFLKKKKIEKNPTIAPGSPVNRDKIKESRRKILKLIKANENSELKAEKKLGQGWLAGLFNRFKQPNKKQVLIDYQQVFNQEKVKRSSAIDQLYATKLNAPDDYHDTQAKHEVRPPLRQKPVLKKASPQPDNSAWGDLNKPSSNLRPLAEKKPVVGQTERFLNFNEVPAPQVKAAPVIKVEKKLEPKQPIKISREGFWSRFLKMIKDKMAALNRPKPGPVKTNLAVNKAKSEVAMPKPPLVKIIPADKKEIKAASLNKKEPSKISEKYPRVIETNLINGEIITFFDWHKKIIILVNAILIPIISVAAIYLGLMYYQKQNQIETKNQEHKLSQLNAEIKQAEIGLKEITDFQVRLKMVAQIFDKHIYWTKLFKFLEDNTIKDVYYTGFMGDTGGDYSLNAVALRFSNISEQVGILKNNEKVTEVRTVGGEVTADDKENNGVKFNLDFSILNNIFTE